MRQLGVKVDRTLELDKLGRHLRKMSLHTTITASFIPQVMEL